MKTNRELNQAYDAKQQAKQRPKQPEYNFKPLEEAVRKWAEMSKAREQTWILLAPAGSLRSKEQGPS